MIVDNYYSLPANTTQTLRIVSCSCTDTHHYRWTAGTSTLRRSGGRNLTPAAGRDRDLDPDLETAEIATEAMEVGRPKGRGLILAEIEEDPDQEIRGTGLRRVIMSEIA